MQGNAKVSTIILIELMPELWPETLVSHGKLDCALHGGADLERGRIVHPDLVGPEL